MGRLLLRPAFSEYLKPTRVGQIKAARRYQGNTPCDAAKRIA
jgi:hypothetical protein